MAGVPKFFLPGATPENQEAQYADMAKRCDCDVPSLNARIYSIVFAPRVDVEWKAAVGEILTGTSRPRRREPTQFDDSEGTTVSAIFACGPDPYEVCKVCTVFPTRWEYPFFLAKPRPGSVIYFASA
jgi:hypothetical protein